MSTQEPLKHLRHSSLSWGQVGISKPISSKRYFTNG